MYIYVHMAHFLYEIVVSSIEHTRTHSSTQHSAQLQNMCPRRLSSTLQFWEFRKIHVGKLR
jgi:hypothetical protein